MFKKYPKKTLKEETISSKKANFDEDDQDKLKNP